MLTTEQDGAQGPSVQGWAQSRAQSPWEGRCAALLFRVAGRGLLAELVHELEEAAQLGLAGAQRTAGGRPGRRAGGEHSSQGVAHQLPVARAELLEQPLGLAVLLLVHQALLCTPLQHGACGGDKGERQARQLPLARWKQSSPTVGSQAEGASDVETSCLAATPAPPHPGRQNFCFQKPSRLSVLPSSFASA